MIMERYIKIEKKDGYGPLAKDNNDAYLLHLGLFLEDHSLWLTKIISMDRPMW